MSIIQAHNQWVSLYILQSILTNILLNRLIYYKLSKYNYIIKRILRIIYRKRLRKSSPLDLTLPWFNLNKTEFPLRLPRWF